MRLTPWLLAIVTLSGAPELVRAAPPDEPGPAVPPPPPPSSRQGYGPYPRSGPASYPPGYYGRPRVGWGWGYYPMLTPPPPPPYAPARPPSRPPEAYRLHARIDAHGAGRTDGYLAGLSFGLDSRYAGFDLSVDALAREQVTGSLRGSGGDPAGWSAAHLTWTILSTPSARLRVLTGASMLSLPSSAAVRGQPWAGKTVFGPDVGFSGHLGLAGPLALEGYARLTPMPVVIADAYAGVAIHGGPLGLTAGWRWVDVRGDDFHQDAPALMFRGPQLGLSLRF